MTTRNIRNTKTPTNTKNIMNSMEESKQIKPYTIRLKNLTTLCMKTVERVCQFLQHYEIEEKTSYGGTRYLALVHDGKPPIYVRRLLWSKPSRMTTYYLRYDGEYFRNTVMTVNGIILIVMDFLNDGYRLGRVDYPIYEVPVVIGKHPRECQNILGVTFGWK